MLTQRNSADGVFQNPLFGSELQALSVDPSNPSNFLNLFLPNLIGLLFIIGAVIFLLMLIWGAIAWISSGGDKAALESARGRISSALIGIVILLSTFAVIKAVEFFFGIKILTIDIGPLIIK